MTAQGDRAVRDAWVCVRACGCCWCVTRASSVIHRECSEGRGLEWQGCRELVLSLSLHARAASDACCMCLWRAYLRLPPVPCAACFRASGDKASGDKAKAAAEGAAGLLEAAGTGAGSLKATQRPVIQRKSSSGVSGGSKAAAAGGAAKPVSGLEARKAYVFLSCYPPLAGLKLPSQCACMHPIAHRPTPTFSFTSCLCGVCAWRLFRVDFVQVCRGAPKPVRHAHHAPPEERRQQR